MISDLQYRASMHHKMESIHTCTQRMRAGCYMASVDLKDAYYLVAVAKQHKKFLKFIWRGKLVPRAFVYRRRSWVRG